MTPTQRLWSSELIQNRHSHAILRHRPASTTYKFSIKSKLPIILTGACERDQQQESKMPPCVHTARRSNRPELGNRKGIGIPEENNQTLDVCSTPPRSVFLTEAYLDQPVACLWSFLINPAYQKKKSPSYKYLNISEHCKFLCKILIVFKNSKSTMKALMKWAVFQENIWLAWINFMGSPKVCC